MCWATMQSATADNHATGRLSQQPYLHWRRARGGPQFPSLAVGAIDLCVASAMKRLAPWPIGSSRATNERGVSVQQQVGGALYPGIQSLFHNVGQPGGYK